MSDPRGSQTKRRKRPGGGPWARAREREARRLASQQAKPWSREWEHCQDPECRETVVRAGKKRTLQKHKARGLCETCYMRDRLRARREHYRRAWRQYYHRRQRGGGEAE